MHGKNILQQNHDVSLLVLHSFLLAIIYVCMYDVMYRDRVPIDQVQIDYHARSRYGFLDVLSIQ